MGFLSRCCWFGCQTGLRAICVYNSRTRGCSGECQLPRYPWCFGRGACVTGEGQRATAGVAGLHKAAIDQHLPGACLPDHGAVADRSTMQASSTMPCLSVVNMTETLDARTHLIAADSVPMRTQAGVCIDNSHTSHDLAGQALADGDSFLGPSLHILYSRLDP